MVAPLHHHGDLLLAQDGRRPRTVSPNRDGSITKGDERMTKGWSFWCEAEGNRYQGFDLQPFSIIFPKYW